MECREGDKEKHKNDCVVLCNLSVLIKSEFFRIRALYYKYLDIYERTNKFAYTEILVEKFCFDDIYSTIFENIKLCEKDFLIFKCMDLNFMSCIAANVISNKLNIEKERSLIKIINQFNDLKNAVNCKLIYFSPDDQYMCNFQNPSITKENIITEAGDNILNIFAKKRSTKMNSFLRIERNQFLGKILYHNFKIRHSPESCLDECSLINIYDMDDYYLIALYEVYHEKYEISFVTRFATYKIFIQDHKMGKNSLNLFQKLQITCKIKISKNCIVNNQSILNVENYKLIYGKSDQKWNCSKHLNYLVNCMECENFNYCVCNRSKRCMLCNKELQFSFESTLIGMRDCYKTQINFLPEEISELIEKLCSYKMITVSLYYYKKYRVYHVIELSRRLFSENWFKTKFDNIKDEKEEERNI